MQAETTTAAPSRSPSTDDGLSPALLLRNTAPTERTRTRTMSAHSPSPPSSSAAVSLPPALVVPSTPRPAPARRAKASDGSNSDELARAEVLELTLYVPSPWLLFVDEPGRVG